MFCRTTCVLILTSLVWAAPVCFADEHLLSIDHVTLIDGTGRAPMDDMSVLIEGKRIGGIFRDGKDVPAGAEHHDATGQFLIPGLIDTHIHLDGGRKGREMTMEIETGRTALLAYIYSGVTSVYDAGNHDTYILKMRADERAGKIISPRIFATGHLIARTDGYGCCAGGTAIDTYEEGVKAIDDLIALEPDLIKFIRERRGIGVKGGDLPMIELDVLSRLITYANERGARTTIHVSDPALARDSVIAGVNTLAHPVYLATLDGSLATLIATRQIPVSTTMVVFDNIARVENDISFFDGPLFKATMTGEELERHTVSERARYVSSAFSGWSRSLMPHIFANVRALYEAGAILALGTDRGAGAMVHQELELLVNSVGVSPLEAIHMATQNGAIFLGLESDLGTIEQGKLADLVLLTENPLEDIRNSVSIANVFKDGELIDRSKLDLPVNSHP